MPWWGWLLVALGVVGWIILIILIIWLIKTAWHFMDGF